VVLRGDTVDRKIDLTQLPARIGRGPNTAVVLPDPMKGVSREHAEIRMVDGRYVLVDLGSENGIWVAGRRVPEVVLDPNVIASIGPFRLMLAEDAAVPDTEVIKQMQRPAAVAVPAAPKPAPSKTAAPQPSERTTGVPPAGTGISNQTWLLGGASAAVVLIVVLAVVFRPSSPPVAPIETVSKPDVGARLADARRQISEGLCAEAVQTIDLTLQDYPNHAELLSEKNRAQQECKPREDIGPPPLDVVAELRRGQGLLESRECRGAALVVTNVLIHEPTNVEAAEIKKRADSCLQPPAPKPTAPQPVVVEGVSPELGGLVLLPNESQREYRERMDAMRARYEEAIAALEKGATARALELLEGILGETPPGYLDVAARVADARRALAKLRLREAQDHEKKEQFDEAIAKLNEARKLDPSLSKFVDTDVPRIQKVKFTRGEEACQSAKVDLQYKRNEAIENFKRALKWLPPDHQCYATAQQYAR
jgi:tetratricopeptide (TPR) repeat protein